MPLALAWDLGAAKWTPRQRVNYANDTTLVLLAGVSRSSNQDKGDRGPGEWMPVKADWCAYDARFATILAHYHLDVTRADASAMNKVLSHC